jgi:hypothetical protein
VKRTRNMNKPHPVVKEVIWKEKEKEEKRDWDVDIVELMD